MSVAERGARLLAGVEEESLAGLLSELRHAIHPQTPLLGVVHLDHLLSIFCAPAPIATATRHERSSQDSDEEGDDSGSENNSARWSNLLLSRSKIWRPVVVELTSALPASGKTNFLYLVTARAVLPNDHGGQGTTVVWFDLDGRFSAKRLRDVMYGVVSASASLDEDRKRMIAAEGLGHVHIFRPQSSSQLIATLDSLPNYLLYAGTHTSLSRRLSLLILDSASAFYWQDRFDLETARLEQAQGTGAGQASRTAEIISRLKKIQQDFDCAVAFSTTSAMSNPSRPPSAAASRSVTSGPTEPQSTGPWTAYATITLSCSRVRVPQFAAEMTLADCMRDQPKRQEAIAEGRFVVALDRSGSEGWSDNIRDAIRQMKGDGDFFLHVRLMAVETLPHP